MMNDLTLVQEAWLGTNQGTLNSDGFALSNERTHIVIVYPCWIGCIHINKYGVKVNDDWMVWKDSFADAMGHAVEALRWY